VTDVEYPWQAWTPAEITARLDGVAIPWCVTAGWAVDVFLGRPTRDHDDLEIAIPRASWDEVRARLHELEFVVAGDGQLWPLTDGNLADHFQTWGRDASGHYRVDVFRDPHDGATWICRREPTITRPYDEVVRHGTSGIPYMAPEIVLLFKAKHARDKDTADLRNCLPFMTDSERDWLAQAIDVVYPQPHPWRELIRGGR
jgi:hypothetical protein